jgi:hypothetical protein
MSVRTRFAEPPPRDRHPDRPDSKWLAVLLGIPTNQIRHQLAMIHNSRNGFDLGKH